MGEAVISLKNISKSFKRYDRPVDRLKEILLPGKSYADEFWALREISLEVQHGETFGIIGQNGSGKSTLLQIIAGTLQPTGGDVAVRGRVSALLELGSGFNPEFTGRQNAFFNGRILGLSQAEIEAKFDDIAAFADIGEFIDQPVKAYSSGMFVRLAFAVAVHTDPDVLIVDEALAVGDGIFVHRCMAKIKDFQDQGGTILFVSHDVGSVSRLCSKTAWVKNGRLVALGEPTKITQQYQAWMYDQINTFQKGKAEKERADQKENNEVSRDQPSISPSSSLIQNSFTGQPYQSFPNVKRFGTGRAEIIEFEVLDEQDKPASFVYPGDLLHIVVKAVAFTQVRDPFVGVLIYDHLRTEITGFNTYQLEQKLPCLSSEEGIEVEFRFRWPEIQGGNYGVEVAIADGSQESHEMLDWLQCLRNIVSGVTALTFGMVRLPNVDVTYRIRPKLKRFDLV